MKFAFIINTDGGHPDSYVVSYLKSYDNYVYGVSSVEEGVAFGKKLAEEGFDILNLCGDFNEDHAEEIAATGIKVRYAKYLPEELKKLETLEDFSNYGMIVKEFGVDDIVKMEKMDPACNLYLRFVNEMEDACEAAKDLVNAGATFIELCSWFDKDMTETIIAAIEGKVPVGTCGTI